MGGLKIEGPLYMAGLNSKVPLYIVHLLPWLHVKQMRVYLLRCREEVHRVCIVITNFNFHKLNKVQF